MTYDNLLSLNLLKDNFDNDYDTIVAVLEVFLQEVPVDMKMFKDQILSGDVNAAGQTAHKIKSSYRLLELEQETALLQKIENLAKSGESMNDIQPLFNQFEENYDKGIQQVARTKDSFIL